MDGWSDTRRRKNFGKKSYKFENCEDKTHSRERKNQTAHDTEIADSDSEAAEFGLIRVRSRMLSGGGACTAGARHTPAEAAPPLMRGKARFLRLVRGRLAAT